MEKGQANRCEHLQNEIHDCRFPKSWSFIGWKTPDTQNVALKDKKISKYTLLSPKHTELATINPIATLVARR
jgi:hypothetical protein